MKTIMNRWLRGAATAAITSAVLISLHGMVFAQNEEFTHERKWDVYFLSQNLDSEEIEYKTASGLVPISMSPTAMGGFGFGYHFMPNVAWRFETSIGYPTFTGHGAATGTTRRVALHTGMLNFDWLLLNRRVTPYFTGGIGWQYIYAQTSNVGTTVAYYDPWYGYTVGVAYPNHTESDFVWTAGLGLRWDVTGHFFLRLSADSNWIDYSNAQNTVNQVRYGLSLGLTY